MARLKSKFSPMTFVTIMDIPALPTSSITTYLVSGIDIPISPAMQSIVKPILRAAMGR